MYSTAISSQLSQREPLSTNSSQKSSFFCQLLSGKRAFYNQDNYLEATRRDFKVKKLSSFDYSYKVEKRVVWIAKQFFALLIFPIACYQLFHFLAAKFAFLPASTPWLLKRNSQYASLRRLSIPLEGEWKYKRIAIKVDGYCIDGMIVGKVSTLENGRWMLKSNGNGELYESLLSKHYFKEILSSCNSNGLFFNYPGVGESSGLPSRAAMAKAYKAMLAFLEDGQKGIGAKEIFGYGYSIGGGVQADALRNHTFKKEIDYLFIKDRTFSTLSKAAASLTYRPLGALVKMLGWEMSPLDSSKQLEALAIPEIGLQTAAVEKSQELSNSSKIKDDGVIFAKASFAKAMLDSPGFSGKNKVAIGVKEDHNAPLEDVSLLAQKVNAFLLEKKRLR